MQTTQSPHDDWDACRDGEIAQLVGQLRRRRQRTLRREVAAAAVLLVVVLAGGYSLLGLWRRSETVYAGIACRDVVQHAEDYLAGELDAETTEQIRRHLAECPYCQEKIEAMRLHSDRDPTANPEANRHHAGRRGPAVVRWAAENEPVFSTAG